MVVSKYTLASFQTVEINIIKKKKKKKRIKCGSQYSRDDKMNTENNNTSVWYLVRFICLYIVSFTFVFSDIEIIGNI